MSGEWSVPAWAGFATLAVVLALVVVAALVVVRLVSLRRASEHTAAALGALGREVETLHAQVVVLERGQAQAAAAARGADEREYVITRLGAEPAEDADDAPAPAVPAPLFADLVLRESVVQAASAAAGLRRALAPEMRHRVRFAMRREVKRARKQRRADVRAARRSPTVGAS